MTTTDPLTDLRARLRYKIDGTPDAHARAIRHDGRVTLISGRRSYVTSRAVEWAALGYTDITIRIGFTRPSRPFPLTQEQAVDIVRVLAHSRQIGSSRWRRFLTRVQPPDVQP